MALILTIHQNDGPLTLAQIHSFLSYVRTVHGLSDNAYVLADLSISNSISYLKVEGEGA